MIPESADIRLVTEALAMAIRSGEIDMSGGDPVRFGAALLAGRYPEAGVPGELEPYSLLLGMVVGGATYRAAVELEDA